MFIQNADNKLVFIKSKNINVFPCGRRRSELVDVDGDDKTVSDRYYIPFDPEARLNTEANNRKHSGLNGFKQDYLLSWSVSAGALSIVIGGYLFTIKLDSTYNTDGLFGAKIDSYFGNTATKIYANIMLNEVEFFEGTSTVKKAGTLILRDQKLAMDKYGDPQSCIDLLIDPPEELAKKSDFNLAAWKADSNNYYFSGLSFSTEELTSKDDRNKVISLRLLVKEAGVWQIYNPSRLPNIEHGETKDSIKIPGDLAVAGTLTANTVMSIKNVDGKDVYMTSVGLKVDETVTGSGVYQLKFYT